MYFCRTHPLFEWQKRNTSGPTHNYSPFMEYICDQIGGYQNRVLIYGLCATFPHKILSSYWGVGDESSVLLNFLHSVPFQQCIHWMLERLGLSMYTQIRERVDFSEFIWLTKSCLLLTSAEGYEINFIQKSSVVSKLKSVKRFYVSFTILTFLPRERHPHRLYRRWQIVTTNPEASSTYVCVYSTARRESFSSCELWNFCSSEQRDYL